MTSVAFDRRKIPSLERASCRRAALQCTVQKMKCPPPPPPSQLLRQTRQRHKYGEAYWRRCLDVPVPTKPVDGTQRRMLGLRHPLKELITVGTSERMDRENVW